MYGSMLPLLALPLKKSKHAPVEEVEPDLPALVMTLPIELQDLITKRLVRDANKPSSLCSDLASWCVANPGACSESTFRDAMRLFGVVRAGPNGTLLPNVAPSPQAAQVWQRYTSWRRLFYAVCADLERFPARDFEAVLTSTRARWTGTILVERELFALAWIATSRNGGAAPQRNALLDLQLVRATYDLNDPPADEQVEQTIIQLLLDGAYPSSRALHMAIHRSSISDVRIVTQERTVRVLLDAGADPNGRDGDNSMLYMAVHRVNVEVIRLLLEAGAVPDPFTRAFAKQRGIAMLFA